MKKSVRFAESSANGVLLLEAEHGLEDAKQTRWSSELAEQRKQDIAHCQKTQLGLLLMDSFQEPAPRGVQNCIDTFVRLPDLSCPRGLERQISREHDIERKKMRCQCIQNVLAECKKLYCGTNVDVGPNAYDDIMWSHLAKVSKSSSQSARHFARRLGKADELWVKVGEQHDMMTLFQLIHEVQARQVKKDSLAYQQEACMAMSGKRRNRRASYHGSGMTPLELALGEGGNSRKLEKSKSYRSKKSTSDRLLDKALAKFTSPSDKGTSSTKKSRKTSQKLKRSSSHSERDSTSWHSSPALNVKPEVLAKKAPRRGSMSSVLQSLHSWTKSGGNDKGLEEAIVSPRRHVATTDSDGEEKPSDLDGSNQSFSVDDLDDEAFSAHSCDLEIVGEEKSYDLDDSTESSSLDDLRDEAVSVSGDRCDPVIVSAVR